MDRTRRQSIVAAAAVLLAACWEAAPDATPSRADGTADATAAAAPAATGSAVAATRAFLATLDDDRRADAAFAFDDPVRTAWAYVPQARGVVHLEGTLRSLELAALNPMGLRRDPGLYFLSTFGTPDDARPWGWRFEGHHLSVNVTQLGPHGQVIAPLFVGANPARVPDGPQAGRRLLADEEDLAFELLRSLDAGRLARAVIADRTFGDIVTGDDPAVAPMPFVGLPAADMTPAQQQALRRLLDVYAGRMVDVAAASQWKRIDAAGFARLHFAWAGARGPGRPHYYRIHGPTVLVEYDNSQDGADHIHTVWRDLENYFGGDLLRRHYAGGGHAHD